jgi:hypothetical protein
MSNFISMLVTNTSGKKVKGELQDRLSAFQNYGKPDIGAKCQAQLLRWVPLPCSGNRRQ